MTIAAVTQNKVMQLALNLLAGFGWIFALIWLAGVFGFGNYRVISEPFELSKANVALSCIEFANADDFAVFKSTGVIRAGASVSNKTGHNCKGVILTN